LFGRSGGQDDPSGLDQRGLDSLKKYSGDVIHCITAALQDEDMLKTKRAKDVLKAAGKVIVFQKAHPDASVSKELAELKDRVGQVKDNSESNGVKSACEKLAIEIDDCISEAKQDSGSGSKNSESSKKKKKKKGKKKR